MKYLRSFFWTLGTVVLSLAVNAQDTGDAGPGNGSELEVGSVYSTSLEKGLSIDQRCPELLEESEEGFLVTQRCPVMAEAKEAGYGVQMVFSEHGVGLNLYFKGKAVGLDNWSLERGVAVESPYDPDVVNIWYMQGVENGILEWRYKVVGEKKIPYALIYRDHYSVQSVPNGSQDFTRVYYSSALVVVQLDGEKSKIAGVIDTIGARQNKLNGNQLAQNCADSLLGVAGLGDAKACQLSFKKEEKSE